MAEEEVGSDDLIWPRDFGVYVKKGWFDGSTLGKRGTEGQRVIDDCGLWRNYTKLIIISKIFWCETLSDIQYRSSFNPNKKNWFWWG